MKTLLIKEEDCCDMCGRHECNSHGYENGIELCSGYCDSIYEKDLVSLDFIKICSKIMGRKILSINKNKKNNYKEYTQLHLDMLKTIYNHIINKKGAEYYIEKIEEELNSYCNPEEFDTKLDSQKEEEKELKEARLKRLQEELKDLKNKSELLKEEIKKLTR